MDLMESLSFELRHFSMLGVFTYRDQPTSKFLAVNFNLINWFVYIYILVQQIPLLNAYVFLNLKELSFSSTSILYYLFFQIYLQILFPLLFYPSIIIELITFTDVDNLDDLTEIAYEFAIHQVSVVKLRCLIANADELRRIFDGFKSIRRFFENILFFYMCTRIIE